MYVLLYHGLIWHVNISNRRLFLLIVYPDVSDHSLHGIFWENMCDDSGCPRADTPKWDTVGLDLFLSPCAYMTTSRLRICNLGIYHFIACVPAWHLRSFAARLSHRMFSMRVDELFFWTVQSMSAEMGRMEQAAGVSLLELLFAWCQRLKLLGIRCSHQEIWLIGNGLVRNMAKKQEN